MLRKLLFSLSIFILLNFNGFAQLSVSQTGTVAQWVQNVLVGPGITVSNVTYTGDAASIGTFTTGVMPTNLGVSAGIVMTSGNVTNVLGPNNSGSITYNSTGGSDPQLAASVNTQLTNVKDAAVLEFDFIPVSDTVKFRYVFGSDEYAEFSNSNFNDVFGFFVSGFNPYGGNYVNVNIAKLPGTNTPVSINNVNNGTSNTGPCMNCQYYVHNYGSSLQYDAFTTVLTAWIVVMPCFTYHIKLAVADLGDESYDSGVFLEANSFMSSAVQLNQTVANNIDTVAREGCTDAIVYFNIPNAVSYPTIINYITTGTATSGVDYVPVGTQVTIPAGQTSATVTIHAFYDNLVEPVEYVKFIVNTSPCTYDTILVYINDNQILLPNPSNDTLLCGAQSVMLSANTSGSVGPYSFLWSTGDTTQNIVENPTATTIYSVTTTDVCGNDTVADIVVTVSEPAYQVFSDEICEGEQANPYILGLPGYSYLWSTGDITDAIQIVLNQDSTLYVTVTDTLGCTSDTNLTIIVHPGPQLVITNDTTMCFGDLMVLSASGADAFLWSNGSSSANITVAPSHDSIFYVVGTNIGGCVSEDSVEVAVITLPEPEISSLVDTLCLGTSTQLTVTGGQTYQWMHGGTDSVITIFPLVTTPYHVIATNSLNGINCNVVANHVQLVERCNKFYIPNSFTPNGDGLNDMFGVLGTIKYVEDFNFYIFDRWGQIVFQTKDPKQYWDGTVNGSIPGPTVFSYLVEIKEPGFDLLQLRGTVTLIK